jgi:GTPase SAR1 family protein
MRYDPTGQTPRIHIGVGGKTYRLLLQDISTTIPQTGEVAFWRDTIEELYSQADGVVLLYSVTDKDSYEKITTDEYIHLVTSRKQHAELNKPDSKYPCRVRYPAGQQRVGCVLVGNKVDLADDHRAVDKQIAQGWADSQGISFFEIDSHNLESIQEAMSALIKSILHAERRDAEGLEEEWRNTQQEQEKTDVQENVDQRRSVRESIRQAWGKVAL